MTRGQILGTLFIFTPRVEMWRVKLTGPSWADLYHSSFLKKSIKSKISRRVAEPRDQNLIGWKIVPVRRVKHLFSFNLVLSKLFVNTYFRNEQRSVWECRNVNVENGRFKVIFLHYYCTIQMRLKMLNASSAKHLLYREWLSRKWRIFVLLIQK